MFCIARPITWLIYSWYNEHTETTSTYRLELASPTWGRDYATRVWRSNCFRFVDPQAQRRNPNAGAYYIRHDRKDAAEDGY